MQVYQQLLHDQGLKATHQRIKVLQYLNEHPTHPSIDEIHAALLSESPSFSKTTVYNTVESLKKAGLITTHAIAGKGLRCDFGPPSHYHFHCRICEKIFDIDMPLPFCDKDFVEGHQIESVQAHFRGICSNCLASQDTDLST